MLTIDHLLVTLGLCVAASATGCATDEIRPAPTAVSNPGASSDAPSGAPTCRAACGRLLGQCDGSPQGGSDVAECADDCLAGEAFDPAELACLAALPCGQPAAACFD